MEENEHEYQLTEKVGNPCEVCGFGRNHPWHREENEPEEREMPKLEKLLATPSFWEDETSPVDVAYGKIMDFLGGERRHTKMTRTVIRKILDELYDAAYERCARGMRD